MTKTIDGMPMGNDILRGLERASELEHVQVGHDNDGQGQRGTDEPGTQPTCLKGP